MYRVLAEKTASLSLRFILLSYYTVFVNSGQRR